MLSLNWNVLMKLNVTRRYADEQGRVVMPLMCMALQPVFGVCKGNSIGHHESKYCVFGISIFYLNVKDGT
jgi:hypothetical protein